MQRTYISDLSNHIDQEVKVQGWLQTLRDQKKMQFLILRDRTGLVQVAHYRPANEELANLISSLGSESALTVTGKVVKNDVVKLGGLEIQLQDLKVENAAEIPMPYDPFDDDNVPAVDFRMDWRYLDLRRSQNLLIFEVQTTLEHAMREFWLQNHFMEIHSPKIMGSPSESGAELFQLDYFDRKAYLAQSPQFYKQMGMAAGFERVFEVGPVFRADPSFTSRHMTEFTGLDMEMSWIDSHEDVMAFTERWLRYAYQQVKEKHGKQIETAYGFELQVPEVPFPRITMQKAMLALKKVGYELPPEKKGDLDPGGERALAQYVKDEFNHDFFFLIDWPVNVRPFYHMRHPENGSLTRSFDLIAGGLEIATGAQREHRYEVLKKQALEKGLGLENIQFYLDFFRFGCPPHGGFGMGLSRLLMVLLQIQNIRETVYLFRGPNRLHP
ncbi:MAG TPA: aspartate--tRNA(Asn) ligase [Anaerolineaceae bacterium]|nr:aspartate--tRNA(Asn) ligase [Anaerolineaceae bacterium]